MKLNNITIPSPKTGVDKRLVAIEKISRVASGRQVIDIRSLKLRWTLSYGGLTVSSFDIFWNAYKGRNEVEFVDEDDERYIVRVMDIGYKKYPGYNQPQDVRIILEEI